MKNLSLLLVFATLLFAACQNENTNTTKTNMDTTVNVSPSEKTEASEAKAQQVAVKLTGYKIGDIADDFKLKNIDNKMVSMSDYPDAKGFIIVFTCNTCPWAVKYEDRIIALHEKYADKGYPLIAINPNDPDVKPGDGFKEMIVRAKEKGFEFPYVLDETQSVYPKYGATKTPHAFLLNKDRKVVYIGAIDDNPHDGEKVSEPYLENAIASMEKGEKIDPAVTKAIGCSIKTKK